MPALSNAHRGEGFYPRLLTPTPRTHAWARAHHAGLALPAGNAPETSCTARHAALGADWLLGII